MKTNQLSLGFSEPDAPTEILPVRSPVGRFAEFGHVKSNGVTYTPSALADYLAKEVLARVTMTRGAPLRVLDPAVGEGDLLVPLVHRLHESGRKVHVVGMDVDATALTTAKDALPAFPGVTYELKHRDFLGDSDGEFDIIIANPPYVRTQTLGSEEARRIAIDYGLEGRVDLYQAFVLRIAERLDAGGVCGIITSNRFFTTKGSGAFRAQVLSKLRVDRIWDLGDTKVFDAAVLPAMLVAERGQTQDHEFPAYTSIYEARNNEPSESVEPSIAAALDLDGSVGVDGRVFQVQQGVLRAKGQEVWRLSTRSIDRWLDEVSRRTWKTFGDIGKVRVGIKTTADNVFIRDDWHGAEEQPELLRPLITHHVAARYRGGTPTKQVLYTHEPGPNGRARPVDLAEYPRSKRYLESNRERLAGRKYVAKAGRNWFEIWVPQDPAAWDRPKVVFRDISDVPTFWFDNSGAVVNGDCYWISPSSPEADDSHLWLIVAVANSTFIEAFYDRKFNNKLYAGRRRYMTQYVKKFPLPDPASKEARQLVRLAKGRFKTEDRDVEVQIDRLVWEAFGLTRPC